MPELHMKDIRRQQMDHSRGRIHHESAKYAGHDQRLAAHEYRIRTTICECGSGLPYGSCCMSEDRQKSPPGIHYALPASCVPGMARRHAIEDAFRLQAFHTFHRVLRDIDDPTLRFVRAVLASAKPVDHEDVLAWNQQFGRHDIPGEEDL